MPSVLSPDMRRYWPSLNLKTKVLRHHTETLIHPILRWVKKEVDVIDQMEFVSIVFTQQGRSWEIPLTELKEEDGKEADAE